MLDTMAISKFLLCVSGGMVGVGWWGLFALQSLWTIKDGTGSFNFQSNELF